MQDLFVASGLLPCLILGQAQHCVSISTPSSVISNVCSNCADRLPSSVTAVQSSDHMVAFVLPMVNIGSDNTNRQSESVSVHMLSMKKKASDPYIETSLQLC